MSAAEPGTGTAGPSVARQRVSEAVRRFLSERASAVGKAGGALEQSTDLFGEGLLDSVALTGLIAAVESATGREIDFIEVDPEALGTLHGIIEELARVIGAPDSH